MTPVYAIAAALLIAGVLVAVGFRHHHRACTHGASSVGPVRIVNGHVTGDTTPHTEVCIP